MAKDLFKRYIWLVDTIFQAGRITFDEINDKWERSSLSDGNSLPKKTFHNHKDTIEEIFDIIIVCDAKDSYRYYIENSEDLDNGSMRNWLLNTFTINNLISESQKLRNRIQLEEIPSGQQHLTPIIEAMRDSYKLEITYQSYWKDHASTFEIEPYLVKIFKQRWYLIAYSEGMGRIMIYALDRIQQLSITQNRFDYPKDFNPEEYFYNCYGIINDEKIEPCTVKMKTNSYQAKYLRGLPLHHSQREIDVSNDAIIFEYYIKPTFDFKKELLSIGAEIEVLEPKWFREEMKELVNTMCNTYKQ
ncbi:MAG TPA: WYL domain-containing protein [Dysgonomonas sp.]|uniref:helix-turn-helix transcriptional regulator n=1 Tax=Dysgonomonas sp. TaxID=1891233 RepID=UPI002CD71C72|nr:WYL domain-containing protein [Dysgonomonas sp.]HML66623.1 WYL domain-containing protein [Dysgonomonas sp.]